MTDAAAADVMAALHSCRCCLRRAPDKDLTTPYTHLGNTEIYSDMLIECFEIHLILDNDGEGGICDVCAARLRDASDFKLQVQRSQAELQARLQGALQVKEEKPAVESIMEDGDGAREEPVLYEEPPVKTEMEDEGGTSDEEELEPQDEPAVGAGTVSEDGAGDTISIIALYEERAVKAEASGDEDCMSRLFVHTSQSSDEAPHASQTCLATSRRGPGLASRMQDMPGDTAGRRAEGRAYTCDTCGEHFTHKSRLIEHIQEHATGPPYCCGICTTQFPSNRLLVKHKRTHMGTTTHPCKICKKEFSTKYNLSRHGIVHTGSRPYACDICHKQFTQKGTLKRHKLIHTGDKPYGCDICKKPFKTKHNLITHVRTHTGQKPYTCIACSKTFACRSNLSRHELIHL